MLQREEVDLIRPESIPVFKCMMCGSCCRMSPISVLPHEVVILTKLADMFDLKLVFEPGYTIYEAIGGVNIAFSYAMQLSGNKCVFLNGAKCMIHDIYKPLICRSFPYIPRHIKYNIDEVNKYIFATTEYALSLACKAVSRDRGILEIHGLHNLPFTNLVIHYYKEGYQAAMEAENIRSLLLTFLSRLWRDGYVELYPARPNASVVSLYDYLRRFYPDLPNIIGVSSVLERLKKWRESDRVT